jgi:hypothetical protein
MCAARKFMLLILAATAAATLGASTATAHSVEVLEEDTGVHCPAVTHWSSGGCDLWSIGELSLAGHAFGIEATVSDCEVDLRGRIDENGEGIFYSATYTNHPGVLDCTRQPCRLPWYIRIDESSSEVNPEVLKVEFCVEPIGGGTDQLCIVATNFSGTEHSYWPFRNEVTGVGHGGPNCEVGDLGSLGMQLDIFNTVEIVH